MTGFDYDKCLDKNGNFHTGKARSYLKSIDIKFDDDLITYIKENGVLPKEDDADPVKTVDQSKVENEEESITTSEENTDEPTLKMKVGFKDISPYGGRQCQFCRSFNRFAVVEEEDEESDEDGEVIVNQISVLIKTDNPKDPVFFCKKNPWHVAKVSTCRKFRRR